ncbi:hypothetical protein IW261DRAFT_1564652 [Armillaria novae-zelandiae]|uniref:Uncharacterized protein n=1 Tax=Armillaria novae-zelandiae TaxID=153914 RepID=A0AA39UEH9_9AGAR|nr:hypothetical protein IW261DRAFT_1564652 [Armillaria novae-zelandiae]
MPFYPLEVYWGKTPTQLLSSQHFRWKHSPSITYLESVTVIIASSWSAASTLSSTALISAALLVWFGPGSLKEMFLSSSFPNHTPAPACASAVLFAYALPSMYAMDTAISPSSSGCCVLERVACFVHVSHPDVKIHIPSVRESLFPISGSNCIFPPCNLASRFASLLSSVNSSSSSQSGRRGSHFSTSSFKSAHLQFLRALCSGRSSLSITSAASPAVSTWCFAIKHL